MPQATDLPEDLKSLARRNALQVGDTHFDDDCRRLVVTIEQVLEKKMAARREREEKERLEAEQREKARLEAERFAHTEKDEAAASGAEAVLDENIQFTAYRPKAICPDQWYRMLVFTHIDDQFSERDAGKPLPSKKMEQLAKQILGSDFGGYRATSSESQYLLPLGLNLALQSG